MACPARRRRLPIGNLTSQYFAKVYLDTLDRFVKEGVCVRANALPGRLRAVLR
jgi:hypothetical protein